MCNHSTTGPSANTVPTRYSRSSQNFLQQLLILNTSSLLRRHYLGGISFRSQCVNSHTSGIWNRKSILKWPAINSIFHIFDNGTKIHAYLTETQMSLFWGDLFELTVSYMIYNRHCAAHDRHVNVTLTLEPYAWNLKLITPYSILVYVQFSNLRKC